MFLTFRDALFTSQMLKKIMFKFFFPFIFGVYPNRQVSFERSDLMENMRATMVAISNLKPEVIKGKYITQVRPPSSSLLTHVCSQ